MAAANRAMKHKGIANQANELQSSFAEADRRIAQEAEDLEAKREADQDKAARKLKASMKKGNSKALKRSIEDAANLGVSAELIDEAKAFFRLESRLHAALAAASLADVRSAVAEVQQGVALGRFPRQPPFVLSQALKYWSERKDDWVDCHVVDVADDSRIQISLKKKAGHWYTLQEQRDKFRAAGADISAASPQVCLDEALILLDKADALESALLSRKLYLVTTAIDNAGKEKALEELVRRAQNFVKDAEALELEIAISSQDPTLLVKTSTLAEHECADMRLIEQAEQHRVEEEQRKRDELLAKMQCIPADNIAAMRAAIAEGEAIGFQLELEPMQKALEDELSKRLAQAQEERAKQEKLAGEFASAKEAQDFGGSVLVAQWRAAVAEVTKPLTISEE
jgi:hypothetical protein